MYKLVKSRFDGCREVEFEVLRGSFQECKEYQLNFMNGGSYIDGAGLDWYTEVLKVEDEKELKTEKIEIRVDVATKKEIKEKAEKLGLTVSAYLVMLAKKDMLLLPGREIAKE